MWLNGDVLPLAQAKANFEDRGHQFATVFYEVIRVYRGQTFTLAEHLDRSSVQLAASVWRFQLQSKNLQPKYAKSSKNPACRTAWSTCS